MAKQTIQEDAPAAGASSLDAKYKVVGVIPGPVAFRGITYDLSDLDDIGEERILLLIAEPGFPYLKKK